MTNAMNRIPYFLALAFVLTASVGFAQTPSQLPDPAILFGRLDSNQDGELVSDEFEALAAIGQGRFRDRPELFERIFKKLDTDQSGGLSAGEFSGLSQLRDHQNPPAAPGAGDGTVSPKAGLGNLYRFEPGPHEITSVPEVVLRDEARGKDLRLRVGYPQDEGPFPVIVFSHGAGGTKDDYQPLLGHWISHGYVTLQANHSDSRAFADPSQPVDKAQRLRDWASRPRDVSFLLDSLDLIEARVGGLSGKLDQNAIGVAGHSFGAHTAQLVAGTTTVAPGGARSSHSDPRPLAFVLISPQGKGPMLDDEAWDGLTRPFLTVTGSLDWGRNGQPVDWRLDPHRLAASEDNYLIFIDGARHDFGGMTGMPHTNAGPTNPNHLAYVRSTTLAFWDAFLKQEAKARSFLDAGVIEEVSQGEARLTKSESSRKEP